MKISKLIGYGLLFVLTGSLAQSNQFNYQTVLRNLDGTPYMNQNVSVAINILQGNPTGDVVYSENFETTTSAFGLVSLQIGSIGDLSVIDWSQDPFFLEVVIDNTVISTNPILSVPYAIYAKTAGTANTVDYSTIINSPDFANWDTNISDDFDGDYNSLKNKPVLFNGDYNSLTSKPQLFDSDYNNLTNKPTFFNGNYDSLSNLPILFDGDYPSLTNTPALFDGDYNSLQNLPVLFDGNFNNLTNIPEIFSGIYDSLTNLPTLFDGDYNSLINLPTLFDGDYNSLSNTPTLFSGDYYDLTNLPTLFSGRYDSLTNTPTTITSEQSGKIDLISIANAVDLDQLSLDVQANNSIVTFPGFGTEPGLALEGNQVLWKKSGINIFYEQGNVGINVDESPDFRGSVLHVGGGILYGGTSTPSTPTPGLLFYDSAGSGGFKFFDNTGTLQNLSSGGISYTGTLWANTAGDFTAYNDVVIAGSLGVGFDVVAGQDFGFSTMILKENNLRILFDDADTSGSQFPDNDWQITINDKANGGQEFFAIEDITASSVPFYIAAGAPSNSLYIGISGVGIGTDAPSTALQIEGSIKASSFIGDGSGLTGITGGTGGVSNPGTTTIAADSDDNGIGEIAFHTGSTSRMVITNEGFVGINNDLPTAELDVNGKGVFTSLSVSGNVTISSISHEISAIAYPEILQDVWLDWPISGKSVINFAGSGTTTATIEGFSGGVTGQEISILNTSQGTVVVNHNGSGSQQILIAGGTNLTLGLSASARFIFDGTNWYCISVNN